MLAGSFPAAKMRHRVAAAVLFGASAMVSPASAQVYFGVWGPRTFVMPLPDYGPPYRAPLERRLHPSLIADDLESRGFRDIVFVTRRPEVYVIEAISPRRESLRLIVDAFDGQILERFPLASPRRVTPSLGALTPLPAPPQRRVTPEPPAKTPEPPKVAAPALPATPPAPTTPARPRSSDWAPIHSVPVAPLE